MPLYIHIDHTANTINLYLLDENNVLSSPHSIDEVPLVVLESSELSVNEVGIRKCSFCFDDIKYEGLSKKDR